ncbi:MAG: hypothetical protein RRA92_10545 [Gemmatimonadota bacterium]|nr:hypothetical protein [Gemmatimonadota bacterium]
MSLVGRIERTGDAAVRLIRNGWFIALAVGLFLTWIVLLDPGADPDMFARVAVGRIVERDGSVAAADPFAYTTTHERWVDHEWLAGVAMWQLAKAGGDRALLGLAILGVFGCVFLTAAAQRRYAGRAAGAVAWLALCLLPLPWVWMSVVRSRALTYVLLPLFLLILVEYRRKKAPALLLVLPPLMVIWANWHGGFVMGLGFLGLTALGALRDGLRFAAPLLLAAAACALVTLVNPYGLEYWSYLRDALTMDRSTHIGEWGPLWGQPRLLAWVAMVAVAWLLSLARRFRTREREVPPEAVLLPAVSLAFAVDSNRLAAAFLVTVAVFGADSLEPLARRVARFAQAVPVAWRRSLALVGVPSLLALGIPAASVALGRGGPALRYDMYPVHALEWLRESRPGGNVLVRFDLGSYALWRLHPRFRVSLDGRYEEVYPQSTFDDVKRAFAPGADGHEEAFARVRPDFIVLSNDHEAASRPRMFGEEWAVVYRDEAFTILAEARGNVVPATGPEEVRPTWEPLF